MWFSWVRHRCFTLENICVDCSELKEYEKSKDFPPFGVLVTASSISYCFSSQLSYRWYRSMPHFCILRLVLSSPHLHLSNILFCHVYLFYVLSSRLLFWSAYALILKRVSHREPEGRHRNYSLFSRERAWYLFTLVAGGPWPDGVMDLKSLKGDFSAAGEWVWCQPAHVCRVFLARSHKYVAEAEKLWYFTKHRCWKCFVHMSTLWYKAIR